MLLHSSLINAPSLLINRTPPDISSANSGLSNTTSSLSNTSLQLQESENTVSLSSSLPIDSTYLFVGSLKSSLNAGINTGEQSHIDQPHNKRKAQEQAELKIIQDQIAQLSARDREVRAHEQAHVAAGGPYAGAASYTYERGPDGVNYAVAGEVSIDVSPAATPEQTIEKARTVKRAALAPAEPSPQDRKVASLALAMEQQAITELSQDNSEQAHSNDSSIREKSAVNSILEASNIDNISADDAQTRIDDQNKINEFSLNRTSSHKVANALNIFSHISSNFSSPSKIDLFL